MGNCADESVVDYFFGLSDTFAATVTAEACVPPAQMGLQTDAAAACALSTTAIVLLDRTDSGEFHAVGVVLVQQPPSSASTGTPAARGGEPEFHAVRPAEKLLVKFFRALNGRNYATAFGLLSAQLQQNWVGIGPSDDALTNFSKFYRDHLRCVTVTSIEVVFRNDPTVSASMGIQWYEVQFADEYISPLPAGSGKLQPYYRVRSDPHQGPGRPPDLITGEATG
jgi:hypothetical protein